LVPHYSSCSSQPAADIPLPAGLVFRFTALQHNSLFHLHSLSYQHQHHVHLNLRRPRSRSIHPRSSRADRKAPGRRHLRQHRKCLHSWNPIHPTHILQRKDEEPQSLSTPIFIVINLTASPNRATPPPKSPPPSPRAANTTEPTNRSAATTTRTATTTTKALTSGSPLRGKSSPLPGVEFTLVVSLHCWSLCFYDV
jgi:hypothetical protein